MSSPTGFDAHGGHRSTLAGWTGSREVAPMLFRAGRSCRRSRSRTATVRRTAVDAGGRTGDRSYRFGTEQALAASAGGCRPYRTARAAHPKTAALIGETPAEWHLVE